MTSSRKRLPRAPAVRVRNRPLTEARILDALKKLIVRSGFEHVGITRVAKEAGVSKELIYRYFGGVPQMVMALLKGQEYWTKPERYLDRIPPRPRRETAAASDAVRITSMLREQVRALRGNDFVQQVRRWELVDSTKLTAPLAQAREDASCAFVRGCAAPKGVDLPAAVGILLAGAIYLVLRSSTASDFIGVDLGTEKGWQRIEGALALLAERIYAQPGPER
jgi:AcrR family transcriptional regulator